MGEFVSKCFIDPSALPNDAGGFVQLCFLGAVYGYILFTASNLIADGSEFLLLVPSLSGIVGSIVLPILGAVPDGAIIFFSGFGDNPQEELSIGVGALAGSTVMLLTLPWFLSVVGGRVDIGPDNRPTYRRPKHLESGTEWKKLSPHNWSLTGSGVGVARYVNITARIMLLTSLTYLVIQGPALYTKGASQAVQQDSQHYYSGLGIVICLVAFCWYLKHQYTHSLLGDDEQLESLVNEARVNAIRQSNLSLKGVLWDLARLSYSAGIIPLAGTDDVYLPMLDSSVAHDPRIVVPGSEEKRLKFRQSVRDLLKPFFDVFDADMNGTLDRDEARLLFKDLNEDVDEANFEVLFASADKDRSGMIEFEEFVDAIILFVLRPPSTPSRKLSTQSVRAHAKEETAEEEEEREEVPDDLAHLSPEEQQRRIKFRAFSMMFMGTACVLIFSDPIVGVFSELGVRTGIPSFYISFILAPLASNASELLAAYNYSLKKTRKSISISFATLLGAGVMNNSFCLGVFLSLVFFRGLKWSFTAETIGIIVVQLCVGLLAQKRVMRLLDGFLILALYPLSLLLIGWLENGMGLD